MSTTTQPARQDGTKTTLTMVLSGIAVPLTGL